MIDRETCVQKKANKRTKILTLKYKFFTKLKSIFFFSIKRASKIISKGSICRVILARLAALSYLFLPKIKSVLFARNRGSGLKRQISGYVLMLFIATLPMLLLGTKYVLDKVTEGQVKIEQSKGTVTYFKRCAKEAALAVAQNWNPGLNLSYQKNALMKVADAVYNDNPCYMYNNAGTGIIGSAIPGLDEKKSANVSQIGSKFNPIKVVYGETKNHSDIMASKEIKYTNATKYLLRYYRGYYTSGSNGTGGVYGNTYFRMWRETDLNTNPSYRYSYFDEIDETERASLNYVLKHHDIYGLPCMGYVDHFTNYPYYPTNGHFWPGCSNYHSTWVMTIPSTSTSVSQYFPWKYHSSSSTTGINNTLTTTYKTRTTPSGTDPVTITVDGDRIKVTTDSSTGYPGTVAYAQPAQLNVDIVLAIPVNGAASNTSNNDAASATAGTPMTSSEYGSHTYPTQTTPAFSSNTTGTPLYQMGQACKNFVKDNFYHIKGVTMGLIPYSAKVSISPDKASSYTIAIPPFIENTPWTNPYYPTAVMYGTIGEKDAPLVQGYKTTAIGSGQTLPTSNTPYYWGGMLTGCPIMCRRGSTGTWTHSGQLACGNLLYNGNPTGSDNYRYMRMNLNPCLAGYANQLSMKCERKCTHFFPNPYYMIEPTADMVKIYEMCNALFPVYDPNNVSNFLFIPFEWANNFWQSWTNNVTASASTSQLSVPSKTTSGRKKVLVMLVNKPDWFEPGEMTYLGFDNDYSSVPLAESDTIDFSIDYSNTSKKFLDGTAYDGTPRGPKKIIRFENQSGIARNSTTGAFECSGSGTGRLYIPRKAMVRLTVSNRGNMKSGSLSWKYYANALNSEGTSCSAWNYLGVGYGFSAAYKNGVFAIIAGTGYYTAYSNNGTNWYRGNTVSPSNFLNAMTANGSYFVALGTNSVAYSNDGVNWSIASGVISGWTMDDDILWNGSQFLATSESWYNITTSLTGASGWSHPSSNTNRIANREQFKYGGGYYVKRYSSNNYVRSSTDPYYSSYNQYDLPLSRAGALNYGPYYWVILTQYGDVMCSTDSSASSWSIIDGSSSDTTSSTLYKLSNKTDWCGICYGDGRWVAYTRSGDVAILDNDPGTIQFTNIGDSTTCTIRDEKTFTIPASSISSTSGGEYYVEFSVSNLKLISAEVTNINYTYVNPKNISYNEVEMIGPGGSSENLKWGTRVEVEPRTGTKHVSQTCTRRISKTCTRRVSKTCTRRVSKTCTRRVSKTCTRNVSQTCSRTITGPGTINLTTTGNTGDDGIGGTVSSTFTMDGATWRWHYFSQALNKNGSSSSSWGGSGIYIGKGMAYKGGRFVTKSMGSPYYTAYSDDGINWYKGTTLSNAMLQIAASNTYFVGASSGNGRIFYSSNGIDWSETTSSGYSSGCMDDDFAWDGSRFFAVQDGGPIWATTSASGTSGWTNLGNRGSGYISDQEQFKYGGGYYLQKTYSGSYIRYSTDILLGSYTEVSLPIARSSSLCYGPGYWMIFTQYGDIMISTNASGSNWSIINGSSSDTSSSALYKVSGKTNWYGICYGNGRWVAYTYDGDVAVLTKVASPASPITSGNFSMSGSSMYQSTDNGWYTSKDTVGTVTIYSPVNTQMTLTASSYTPNGSSGSSGSITFYSDNIGSSYNVRKDSTSGTSISLGTAQTITESQKFVFSGGSMPSSGTSSDSSSTESNVPNINFCRNLSVKKVKYSASNANITSCVLRNQILRDYLTKNGSVTFILSDGSSGSNASSILNSQLVVSPGSSNDVTLSKFRDTCIKFNDTYYYGGENGWGGSYCWISGNGFCGYYMYLDIYGVSPSFVVALDSYWTATKLAYYTSSGYSYIGNVSEEGHSWTKFSTITSSSPYSDRVRIKFYSDAAHECTYRYVVQNTINKTLQSTTPITSNPITYTNLIQNKGIYLANYNNENWICFQGDGQLEVTVSPTQTYATPYLRVNSATNNSITTTISSSDWTWDSSTSKYKATLKLRNAKITKISQPNKTENYDCSYSENYDCSYDENYDCSYDENYDCSYNENYDCSYDENYDCSYDTSCTHDVNVTYTALRSKSPISVTYSYNNSSGTRYVTTGTFSSSDSQDSEYPYYIKLPGGDYVSSSAGGCVISGSTGNRSVGKFAARKYSVTEAVYDMIDFSANSTSNKNGVLSTDFNGSYSNNFYYFGSSSVTKTLTTSRRGRLELKVAPSFYADSGYIKMNYGTNTTAKTITAPTTLSMKYSDLSSGKMQFTLYNCVILYAKLCDVEAVANTPSFNNNTRNMMWNSSSVSATNISLSGTYSNYSTEWGWHRLTTNSFLTWSNSCVSDITSVLDATSPISAYWYMPQNVYTDFANTNLVGPMRLFAPITRDSSLTPRKYCQMYAYDSNSSNKANLMWHNFTLPANYVLMNAGYQSAGGDATIAVRSATAAVCAKLKTDYGSNLRVYIVKYRKQAQYKTFPMYNVTQSNANHDYSVIDACATSSSYVYDISTEADLKSTLNTIAANIKSFAGGVTEARNVD